MTLTERLEFKNLKELQNLKDDIFSKMKEIYGEGVAYTIKQADENYFHLEFEELYTTGAEKYCYEGLLEYLEKQSREQ